MPYCRQDCSGIIFVGECFAAHVYISEMAPGSIAKMVGETIDATADDRARLTDLYGLDQQVYIRY